MKKLVLNIILFLFALFGVISCNIKEDMSNCPGSMILDYSAYDDVILDDITSEEQIDIFIFDPNDICIDVYSFTYGEFKKSNFEVTLPIKYRGYNAVVWQGLNSEKYDSRTMALGDNYTNFHMNLVSDLGIYSGVPDPLWASPLEPIDFCAKISRHRVYMTRLHTEMNVTLQKRFSDGSLAELNTEDYKITISAANDRYNTDYTIASESRKTTYTNIDDLVGTLRITPDMDCILSVDRMDRNIDLVEYMLATKTNTSISDQEFLDLNKVWNIELVVEESNSGFVAVCISINDWVKWFSKDELS